MSKYKTPGSYVERVNGVRVANDLPSTSIGGIIGTCERGIANKPVLITSWSQFLEKFAKGVDNPFIVGNLADAVYGFFANGGTEIYVARAVNTGVKASATLSESEITVKAKEEGTWGNNLHVEIKNEAVFRTASHTLVVKYKGVVVEEIKGLTDENFLQTVNSTSKFIEITGGTSLEAGSGTLSGGSEQANNVASFKACLSKFDVIEDINMLAITGETATGIQEALVEYCTSRGTIFPVIDVPMNLSLEEVMAYKDRFSSHVGALYYPNIVIQDLVTGESKTVAPSGHVMGMYARTDSERGVHKAPAGVEATLNGAIAVETELSHTEQGILNDYEINCIVPKKGCGIVVWGARLLKTNGERQYISDLRLDMYVEELVRRNTEWAVFEPKDSKLFSDVTTTLTGLMMTGWQEGKYLGDKPEDAFYVKCDKELNPDLLSSELHIEVGYAKKKPAEFVITKISHKQS